MDCALKQEKFIILADYLFAFKKCRILEDF